MFRRILVPLDGSTFSELALSYARALALCSEGEIVLVRVDETYEPPVGVFVPVTVLPEAVTLNVGEYLQQHEMRLRQAGIRASSAVLEGRVADAIVRHAREVGADVIVMCTHGRSGLQRVLLGSVAEQVVKRAPCPVMLIRPRDWPETA
ncbi:MAG: universal stress protein [Thermoflexales bacterium]|nr:universal stress protein [Thermoflexales bacterium]MCS7324474.1 universal stress protein [Thermoflexales bacterium]MCX7939441.1 universal stress protein [Thermoflexales bacterium]MDW8054268.1 universal stress protein [Anaerolineae bacterium]MDW8292212.1 universal stress protein [Anaerolineae bacterium]